MHPYREYVNPYLGKLLESIRMDKSYIRGEKCYLYDEDNNEYLDCIAAYGALPFGYNPEEVWQTIIQFQQSKEPSFIQPSALNAAGVLARELIKIVPEGLKYVTFTNSGAEAVEAAIKLCRSSTGRMGILAARNSFHGKTLGALSATGKDSYQKAFGAPVEGFHFVQFGDLYSLEMELQCHPDEYAAFIVEPIQGEGGIVEPPAGYLKGAKEICEKYGVLLIIDEIQTGLGRTGRLFACEEEVCPDVLLVAKALGGGIMPIGACISTEEAYNDEFAEKHSSTFAGNSLACRVGIKALEILTRRNNELIKEVKSKGERLKDNLNRLKEQYPDIIHTIRGRGFMLGIEFNINRNTFPDGILRIMAQQEILTPVISSYLLNREGIRVAPTLNGANVIRIEPPLIMTEEQCDRIVSGIENMLKVLNTRNTAAILSHLIGVDIQSPVNYKSTSAVSWAVPSKDPDEGRFAFLMHPIDVKNYTEFDESLAYFNEKQLMDLTNRWNDMVEPFVVAETRITSKCGKNAYGEFIAVPKTAEQLMNLPKKQVLDELKAAVGLAKKRGARIIGLGAYTSVASMGGLYLKDEGIPLTTGNSYTVVSAVDAVTTALEKLGMDSVKATAAIVGGTGSIGKGVATLLSEAVSRIILIGNPQHKKSSMKRLYGVAAEICQYAAVMAAQGRNVTEDSLAYTLVTMKGLPKADASLSEFEDFVKDIQRGGNCPVLISTDIDSILPLADIVISATSHVGKIITPGNVKYGAVVCDMSRPANVSEEISTLRPDVLVIDGGVVEVPGLPDLGWNFGFDKGLSYACMAETMMLSLEHHYEHTSIGSSGVTLDSILFTRQLAEKHGFTLAAFRSFDRPLSSDIWERVIQSRAKIIV